MPSWWEHYEGRYCLGSQLSRREGSRPTWLFKSLHIIIYLRFIKKNNNAASISGEAANEDVGYGGPTHFSSAVKEDWQNGLLSIGFFSFFLLFFCFVLCWFDFLVTYFTVFALIMISYELMPFNFILIFVLLALFLSLLILL